MTQVRVLYFAALRDAAGMVGESVSSPAANLGELYEDLRVRHALPFHTGQLRVAVDDAFARWDDPLLEGSEVVFIPPVSGG